MLNRRDALVTGAAIMLTGRTFSQTDAFSGPLTSGGTNHFGDVSPVVASECLRCADACDAFLQSQQNGNDAAMAKLCRTTSDLCRLTAKLLNRRGQFSTAVVQSCSDACGRVIQAGANLPVTPSLTKCRTTAEKCQTSCDLLVNLSMARNN